MLASRRTDAVVAAALAAVSVAQVLIFPIAPRAIGVAVALASTVPIAFRRDHPVAALIAGTTAWAVPTDGYLVVGYVAVFLLLYSFAVQVDDVRLVALAPPGKDAAPKESLWDFEGRGRRLAVISGRRFRVERCGRAH